MSDYSNLAALVEQVVDAAIESDLAHHEFHGSMKTGFSGELPMLRDRMTVWVPVRVSPRGEVSFQVDTTGLVPHAEGWATFRRCFERWPRVVPEAFRRWDNLPDPGAFNGAIGQLRHATGRLAQQMTLQPDGTLSPTDGRMSDIGFLNDRMSKLDGVAITAFQRDYTENLPYVVSGQAAVTQLLHYGLVVEQQVWQHSRETVVSLASASIQAMRVARPRGGHIQPTIVWKVLESLSGAATVLVTEGTGATVLEWVDKLFGTISRFTSDPPPPAPPPLAGPDPDAVLTNLVAALQQLNEDITSQERRLSDRLYDADGVVETAPASFDLVARGRAAAHVNDDPDLLTSDDPASIVTAASIRVNTETISLLAGDVLPGLARELRAVDLEAAAGTDGGLWARPPGIGYVGTYQAWNDLSWRLSTVLEATAWELESAAERLEVMADSLGKTDEAVRADLERQAAAVRDSTYYDPPDDDPAGGIRRPAAS